MKSFLAGALIGIFLLSGISATAQDLVPVSDITGGSSVFVFRSSSRTAQKKFSTSSRSTRTKAQRIETAKKIKKQYDTLAQVQPNRAKSAVVTPDKVPPTIKTMPKEQASRLFAGVGEYYIARNDLENSLNFFRESIVLDAKNTKAKEGLSDALSAKGNELLFNEQTSTAKAYFLEALKNNPKNSAAYFGLGEVYTDLSQDADAIASYEKALESDPGLTEIYLPLGILYYQNGDIAKADELLTKALANSSESAETQVFLGVIRTSQNRNDDALAAFKRAKTLDPNLPEAYYRTGEVLTRLGRPKDALVEYQKAAELRPNYFEAWRGAGSANAELGNFADAVVAYKAAVRSKNDNADVYLALGDAYRMTGKFNDAESVYATARDLMMRGTEYTKDDTADVNSKIGYVIGRQCEENMRRAIACRWPAAIKAFEKATDLGGTPADFANLGWAYYNDALTDIYAGQPDSAKPKLELAKLNLQKALTGSPAITDGVMQNLGAVMIDLGDFDGAIQSLVPVVKRRPDWNFSKYALGTAYYKAKDFTNAEKMFRAAVDKDPQNAGYLSSLGYSLVALKNGKEVKKIIDRLKVLDQNSAIRLQQSARMAGLTGL
jgi:tetratricopeptide (TPR) repeat protein